MPLPLLSFFLAIFLVSRYKVLGSYPCIDYHDNFFESFEGDTDFDIDFMKHSRRKSSHKNTDVHSDFMRRLSKVVTGLPEKDAPRGNIYSSRRKINYLTKVFGDKTEWLNNPINKSLKWYCGVGSSPCDSTDLNTLEIILYKNNLQYHFSLDALGALETYSNSAFDRSADIAIFFSGYTSTDKSEGSVQIRNAYAQLEATTNFFMVNTSVVYGGRFLSVSNYVAAAQKTVCVGDRVAKYLAKLHKLDIDEDSIHMIGHSLGAQTAHAAAVKFERLRGVKVGRITGLDPAGPCFDPSDNQLNKADARHVSIILTNSGIAGTKRQLGHANFMPNGGQTQPGCGFANSSCSHIRACLLYSESVISENCLYAPRTDVPFSERFLKKSNLKIVNSAHRWIDSYAEGVFDAFTNDAFPFCRGEAGININE